VIKELCESGVIAGSAAFGGAGPRAVRSKIGPAGGSVPGAVPGAGRVESGPAAGPRAGTRAARLAQPTLSGSMRQLAGEFGVCIRPVWAERSYEATGETDVVGFACGATLEKVCPACARAAKRDRCQWSGRSPVRRS
jgi:hypothetical protein